MLRGEGAGNVYLGDQPLEPRTYSFCIFNVIRVTLTTRSCSTSHCVGGDILFHFGPGDAERGVCDVREGDELVRDPFSCCPCCSQALIPSAKAIQRRRGTSGKLDFSPPGARRKK